MTDAIPVENAQPALLMPGAERDLFEPGLPVTLTSFIGRQRDIEAVVGLVRSGARLVTLTGPGGVGKTRLALEVLRVLEDDSPEGIAFVDLVPIADPSLVAPAIAQALGIRESADSHLVRRLASVLRDRAYVLVLDNFEHVIEAAPLMSELLTACSRIVVIVTSRERLHLTAEQIYPVAPLEMPPKDDASAADLDGIEAVRLFVARARQIDPTFDLDAQNAADVVEICRRLDGLPLAIELAAARTNLLPPPALVKRLDNRLPLLTQGRRDQPERQQTMVRAIAWSYDLLSDSERSLLRRLAVFAGGFILDAAEAVSRKTENGKREGDPSSAFRFPPSVDVIDGIASLVDKSLLRQTPVAGGEPRFTMLETVREFALERLTALGEATSTRDRHAAWALSLTDRAHREFVISDQRLWVDQMERDHANVRAAAAWLIERGDHESALHMAGSMYIFWFLRGHLREGAELLIRTLDGSPDANPADRSWAYFGAGFLTWAQGDFARAEELASRGLSAARDNKLVFETACCLFLLHDAVIMQGRLAEAIAIGEDALVEMRASGNRAWLAHVLCDVGTAISTAGDKTRGAQLVEEGLALHRVLGNKLGAGNNLSDLGFDALDTNDRALAVRHFDESLRLLWESGDRWYLASPVTGIAILAADAGEAEAAARLIGASNAIRERSGAPLWPDEQSHVERATKSAQTALGSGFERVVNTGRVLTLDDVVQEAHITAAALLESRPLHQDTRSPGNLGLSPREIDVLKLLTEGKSNLEIADALFVSRGTVRTHVSSILAKLDAKSRTEAAAIAHREGLV